MLAACGSLLAACGPLSAARPAMADEAPAAPESLTVGDAVRAVLATHPGVAEALHGVDASRARVAVARADALPTGDADFTYARVEPVPAFDFGGENLALAPEDNWDEHVSLRETVYDFGRTDAAVRAGEAAVRSASDNVDLVRTQLAFATIQSFYTILFLRQSIDVQQHEIDALNGHLDLARKRVASGSATDYDIITTQVRVAAAENRRVDLQDRESREEAAMRRLLGYPPGTPLRLSGDFTTASAGTNADSLAALAMEQRTELRQALDAEQTARLDKAVVSLRDRPSLGVSAQYGIKNGYIPNLEAIHGNWVLGIAATVPIWNGHRTENEEAEAEARVEAAASRTAAVRRTVEAEVEQAIADVRANAEEQGRSQLQIDQAELALSMARVRYENGVITTLDLLDAETSLEQAELSRLQTLYRGVLNRYALARAVGGPLAP